MASAAGAGAAAAGAAAAGAGSAGFAGSGADIVVEVFLPFALLEQLATKSLFQKIVKLLIG